MSRELDERYKEYHEMIKRYWTAQSGNIYPKSNEYEIELNEAYHVAFMATGLSFLEYLAEMPETRIVLKKILEDILRDD